MTTLLRSRPRVTLRLPRTVLPGSSFVAELTLDSKRDIPVDAIDVHLEGTERSQIGEGNQAVRNHLNLLTLSARVSAKRSLPAGSSSFRARFDLPADLPASYVGTRASVEYLLTVHVSIPWWPDRKAQYVAVVAAPAAVAPDSEGVRFSSRPAGPQAREPHVECSLATVNLQPGSVLTGSVALSNVQFNHYRDISIDLVGVEFVQTADRRLQRRVETVRYSIQVPVADPLEEARPHRFQMRIPPDIPHSRKTVLFELAWFVEVKARLAWAKDVVVNIPVTVYSGAAKPSDVRRVAPTVGADRVHAVWAAVAQGSGLRLDDDVLTGRVGDASLTIRRDHRGRQGIFLLGELAIPSLGLGLAGGPAQGLSGLWSSGVELGDRAWDRRNRLRGREEPQVRAFLAPLRDALVRLDLDRLDDRCVRIQRKEAGLTAAPLDSFVRDVLALAKALGAARAAIPVPVNMTAAEASWASLAQRLGTRLEKGDMAVAGTLDQVEVEVLTEWDDQGKPRRTMLMAKAPEPVRQEHQLRWQSGEYTFGDRARLPEPARELLDQGIEGADSFSIDADGLEASLPAPMLDASPALGRLRTMCDLLTSLRLAAGPYR